MTAQNLSRLRAAMASEHHARIALETLRARYA